MDAASAACAGVVVYVLTAGVPATDARARVEGLSASLGAWALPGGGGGALPRFVYRSLSDVTSGFGLSATPAERGAPAEVVLVLASGPEAARAARRALAATGTRRPRPVLMIVDEATPEPARCGGNDSGPGEVVAQLPASAGHAAAAGAIIGLVQAARALDEHAADSALQAQVAITAARQIEEAQNELQLAGQLQRELLPPHLPSGPGLELAAMYRPGATLSGDFYDAVRLDDHRVGLLLADACGHGVPAALLVMLVSKLLPMTDGAPPGPAGVARVVPPAEALARLNDSFIERRGVLSALISATYAVIDTRAGTATVASAGHPPPILAGPAREPELIPEGGPLLGVTPGAGYHQRVVELRAGDTLLLYSDGFEHAFGLPEAEANATHHNADRGTGHVAVLASMARERPQRPLHAAVQGLEDLVLAQRGSLHQIDDITLLAARVRAD